MTTNQKTEANGEAISVQIDGNKKSFKISSELINKLMPFFMAFLLGDKAVERLVEPSNNKIEERVQGLETEMKEIKKLLEDIKDSGKKE